MCEKKSEQCYSNSVKFVPENKMKLKSKRRSVRHHRKKTVWIEGQKVLSLAIQQCQRLLFFSFRSFIPFDSVAVDFISPSLSGQTVTIQMPAPKKQQLLKDSRHRHATISRNTHVHIHNSID